MEEDRKDEVTKVNEKERSLPNSSPSSSLFYTSISPSSPSSFYHSPSVLSILLFIFLPSCPLPHICQLCLQALSKLEFFSLALRKIALSLKSVFPSFPPTSLSVLTWKRMEIVRRIMMRK
jgi:hypothetical protein